MLRLLALGAGFVALLGGALAVVVVGAAVALVLGRSVAAVVRWLKRSALAVGLSGLGGITAAIAAGTLTTMDPGVVGLLTALFLFVVTLATLPLAARREQGGTGVPKVGRRRGRQAARAAARTAVLDPLGHAWSQAATRADWAQSRIAVAQASCERLLMLADQRPLDAETVEWAGVIRRRVPDLVQSCLDECAQATPAERETHLEHLVEALEKIGGEADRRRSRELNRSSLFGVQRTYVDQRTGGNPLAPDA